MKPLIGIIMRKSLSESGNKVSLVYDDIMHSIISSSGIPIGIFNNNIDLYLNICNGFILQGGDDIDLNNIKLLNTLRKLNKPVLGICLGMQEMGYLCGGDIYNVDNHKGNVWHNIKLNNKSKLYKIIKKDNILVNSRHKSAIKNSKLSVSAYAYDNVIEAVEDSNLKFFMGLQWHPENMYDDENIKALFDYFVQICHD